MRMHVNVRLLPWEKWEKLSPNEKKEWASHISTFCREMKPILRGDTLENTMTAFSDPQNVAFFLDQRKNFVIAMNEKRVVGLLGIHSTGEGRFQRDFVAVLPTFERSGIATKLSLVSNSLARRKKSSVEIDFRSPEGRNFASKLLNMPRRKVYQKGKPAHWAEEYDVAPEMGNIRVRVRTAVPFRPAPTKKPFLQQLKTRWKMFRRKRK